METKVDIANGTVKPVSNDDYPVGLPVSAAQATLGRHLACHLGQIGATDVFSVPGVFNLTLLDYLIAEPGLNLIGCCNELNAGYAADGYARARDVGACVATFTVRGLSILNAIAGAYSENLPVICIVGGPNSNDTRLSNKDEPRGRGRSMCGFPKQVGETCSLDARNSDPPRPKKAFIQLADSYSYAMARVSCPNHFIGTYWGAVSTTFCAEIVESVDAYLFAGPIFNDYSSVGFSLLIKKEKSVIVLPDRVIVANGPTFGCILMSDFLKELAERELSITQRLLIISNYKRIFVPDGEVVSWEPGEPLKVDVLFKHIQAMLSCETAVIAETGDSWFNCQELKLPECFG